MYYTLGARSFEDATSIARNRTILLPVIPGEIYATDDSEKRAGADVLGASKLCPLFFDSLPSARDDLNEIDIASTP